MDVYRQGSSYFVIANAYNSVETPAQTQSVATTKPFPADIIHIENGQYYLCSPSGSFSLSFNAVPFKSSVNSQPGTKT